MESYIGSIKDITSTKWVFEQNEHNSEIVYSNNYVNSLKVFYLNPQSSNERRQHMEEQFHLSNIPSIQIERVEPTKFPSVVDYTLKNNIISWDHIGMWQKAFEQNCDGALFFEDDVFFLKNWKQIVQDMFDKFGRHNTHIIRFDPAPLITINDLSNKQVVAFPSKAFACMGGYYMSRDAIITSLNFVKTNSWKWITVEDLLSEITRQYFQNFSYETVPRICIQNWFLDDSSAMQTNEHIKKRKEVMCSGYFPYYYDRYMLNHDIKNKLTELFKHKFNYTEKLL